MPAVTSFLPPQRRQKSPPDGGGRLREARGLESRQKRGDWASVADGETINTYHPILNSNVWSLASGSESNLDGLFTRQIVLGPAYRTLTNQLTTVASGNTLDPSVKHVNITVTWSRLLLLR
jgi:hypothetical protein